MIARLIKKTDIKIYILYAMKNIGYPLEFDRLNDALISDGALNSFSFAECFAELLETGNVKAVQDEGREQYIITEQGVNVADNLIDSLIPSVQRSALACAVRLTSFDKRGAKTEHSSSAMPDGRYLFDFRVIEHEREIFKISVLLENKEQLDRVEYNMSKNPDGVYKSMIALITGQADYLLDSTL